MIMRKTANSQMEKAINIKRVFTQKELIEFVVYDELMFDRRWPINQLDKLYNCEFPKEFTIAFSDDYRTDMTVSVIKTEIGNYVIDSFVDDDSDAFIRIKSYYPLENKIKFNIDTVRINIESKSDCPVDISDWIGTRWSHDHLDWVKTEIDKKDVVDFMMHILDMEIRIEEFIELNKFFNTSVFCYDKFVAKIDEYAFLFVKKGSVYSMSLINPGVDLDSIEIPYVSVYTTNQSALWYFRVYIYDAHRERISEYCLDDEDIIVRWEDGPYEYYDFEETGLNRNEIDDLVVSKSV